ncbi:hypothetical protein EV356DRAFT_502381 [Viridothelium virens]|uniref:Uncharacterized protein n=1 Tax=Viridothelium virens TaxID=1048519 RepID=A0A6A6HMT3_VIRVR|nr:hypothetical protein EV356DRAFT_502381 [Viridothelium virens]
MEASIRREGPSSPVPRFEATTTTPEYQAHPRESSPAISPEASITPTRPKPSDIPSRTPSSAPSPKISPEKMRISLDSLRAFFCCGDEPQPRDPGMSISPLTPQFRKLLLIVA